MLVVWDLSSMSGTAKTPQSAAAEHFAHYKTQVPCRRMNQQAFEDIGMVPQVNSPNPGLPTWFPVSEIRPAGV